jgi:hypothetical protein
MSVLTDLRNRGVRDVFFVVCDGLKGLPDVVGNAWSAAIVQTCTSITPTCGLCRPYEPRNLPIGCQHELPEVARLLPNCDC